MTEKDMPKTEKRSAFVAKDSGERWPEWSRYVVGVGGGFCAFEDEKEGEAFLSSYLEGQKKSA